MPSGIIVVIFFVVYQQLENHLLQPLIFSRTVQLNPLTVLIAILIAVELAGLLGALLAIPFAAMIQIIVRDVWRQHRGRLRPGPTVGENRASPARDPDPASGSGSERLAGGSQAWRHDAPGTDLHPVSIGGTHQMLLRGLGKGYGLTAGVSRTAAR